MVGDYYVLSGEVCRIGPDDVCVLDDCRQWTCGKLLCLMWEPWRGFCGAAIMHASAPTR